MGTRNKAGSKACDGGKRLANLSHNAVAQDDTSPSRRFPEFASITELSNKLNMKRGLAVKTASGFPN